MKIRELCSAPGTISSRRRVGGATRQKGLPCVWASARRYWSRTMSNARAERARWVAIFHSIKDRRRALKRRMKSLEASLSPQHGRSRLVLPSRFLPSAVGAHAKLRQPSLTHSAPPAPPCVASHRRPMPDDGLPGCHVVVLLQVPRLPELLEQLHVLLLSARAQVRVCFADHVLQINCAVRPVRLPWRVPRR